MQKFVGIGQAIAEIWRFFDYSKRRPSAILGLLCACLELFWTTHNECLVVFITAKFGWNRCSSFDNMQVLLFNKSSLKMFIDASNGVFFLGGGISPPKWGAVTSGPLKGISLYRSTSYDVEIVKIRPPVFYTAHSFTQSPDIVCFAMGLTLP